MKFEIDKLHKVTKIAFVFTALIYCYFTYSYGFTYFFNKEDLLSSMTQTGVQAISPTFYLINTIISLLYIIIIIMLLRIKESAVYLFFSLVIIDILLLVLYSQITLFVLLYKILIAIIVGICIYKEKDKYFI